MNRQWMYNADRCSKEFIDGLHYFWSVAEANKQNGFMCCPCVTMEDNEEEDFDDHFPGNAGIGAFDDDIPMEEPTHGY